MTMTEDRALQTTGPQNPMTMPSGMQAVALLTDDEFSRNLSMLKTAAERTRQIQQTLMTEGRDYGVIPGTKKPTLLKPGAEILALAYGFVYRIEVTEVPGDGKTAPPIRYDAQTFIHAGAWDGPIVAVGNGTCNSWETKYRYRTTSSGLVCPNCGKPGLIRTRERPAEGRKPARPAQYWHPTDARPDGGCNQNFPLDEPTLAGQRATSEKVENTDPYEQANTILKIAEKRSLVDGILRATGTSGLFTVEEEEAGKDEKPDAKSRREFNEWVAETGLDPVEVMNVGKALYPERDLRKIAVWERTAWRAVLERDVLFAEHPAAGAQQPAQQPPAAQQAPAATEPTSAPQPTEPRNVTPPTPAEAAEAREVVRADAAAAPAGPNGIGKSADAVAAATRDREPVATGAGRMWTAEELADIGR